MLSYPGKTKRFDALELPGSASRMLERVFVVVGIVVVSGGLDLFLPVAISQAVAGIVYALALVAIVVRPRRFMTVVISAPLLSLLLVFAAASILWSYDAAISLRRYIALLGTSVLALYVVGRYEPRVFLRIFTGVVCGLIVCSVGVALLLPEWGVMTGLHSGAWRGVFEHKNILGRVSVLGIIGVIGGLHAVRRLDSYLASILLLSICVVAILLSRSATSFVLVVAIGIVAPLLPSIRLKWGLPKVILALVGFPIIVGIGVVLFGYGAPIVESIGRDVTLSGRTRLWSALGELAGERWMFGYGYGGFWLDGEGPSNVLYQMLTWEPSHAHSGYLEVILHLGLVGVAVFLLFFVKTVLLAVRKYKLGTHKGIATWQMLSLLCISIVNIPESNLLEGNNLFWFVMCVVSLQVRRPQPVD